MATATLERNGTSVEIQLLEEGRGPVVSRDFGKPNQDIQETGAINPRFLDNWSGLEQYTITGRFVESDAYDRAITLMDLIKSGSNGNQLTLNIDMPEYDTDIPVCPSAGSDSAASVTYPSGYRDYVTVDVALTRANTIEEGPDQPATTPTASGTGPIQLTNGQTTVDLVKDVEVSRSVGRPKSTVRQTSNGVVPDHYDKFKTASDRIELSFEFVENAVSQVNEIISLFNTQLGRRPLTLDFNGLYNMGELSVIPDGSQALRHTRNSAEQGVSSIPTVNLRRVFDPL